jgi:hypothetical protein
VACERYRLIREHDWSAEVMGQVRVRSRPPRK